MITLFIDTSFADVSIALLKDNKIISKKIRSIPNEHSKYAVSYVDDVLKEAKIEPKEVNNIMVVNGPGSFTGIRIGLTIAKVYAYLLNINVTSIFNKYAYILAIVSPILIPVKEPGPFTTIILSTSFGFIFDFFNTSSIYVIAYFECSLGILFTILFIILLSFNRAIDTSEKDVSINKVIIL